MSEPILQSSCIQVSDLRIQARVGVNPGEQDREQPIALDLHLGIEHMARATASERLQDTTDYVEISRVARRVVQLRHYPLVENMASAIARGLLELQGATWARVRVLKLGCMEDAAAAGVELQLEAGARAVLPVGPNRLEQRQEPEDVVIIGGGAAGLSAALWCWRLGHAALLVDPSPRLGGQLHQVHGQITDLPAMPALDGATLVRRLERQFMDHQGRWLRAALVSLAPAQQGWQLELRPRDSHAGDRPETLQLPARTVILATGIRRRTLGVPGEQEFFGKGLLATAAMDPGAQAGRRVVVVGCGDAACENALILARAGARVVLVHRSPRLSCLQVFARSVRQEPQIDIRLNCQVSRFLGRSRLEAVELSMDHQVELLEADAALVRVGWIPNSGALPRRWLGAGGHLRAVQGAVPGEERIFAAGDITSPRSSSVANAFGAGANAARAAVACLECDE